MPEKKEKTNIDSKKLYFVYFIIFTIVVLIIFAYLILGYYWHFWSRLRQYDKYYKGIFEQAQQILPQITKYDPAMGQVDAPITIIEYNEITCSPCNGAQSTIRSLEKLYGNRIRTVFKGLPITLNPENRPSLMAAYCAWDQNKFWDYKNQLYLNSNELSQAKYLEIASLLGLDLEAFKQCLSENKYTAVLDKNLTEAVTIGVTSVPTIFINDQKVEGFINYYTLKDMIDKELKK